MKRLLLSIFLLLVIIACGCVEIQPKPILERVDVSIDAPSQVYRQQEFTVYLDINNAGNGTLDNLEASFFNTGSFDKLGSCTLSSRRVGPYGMQVLECKLSYTGMLERDVSERIDAYVKYKKNISAMADFSIMTPEEKDFLISKRKFQSLPTAFSNSNADISISAQINENPAILVPERDIFIYFEITNTGTGFVNDISSSDIFIWSEPKGLISKEKCYIPPVLIHNNGVFPKIACKIDKAAFSRTSGAESSSFFITVKYQYELRSSAYILVKK